MYIQSNNAHSSARSSFDKEVSGAYSDYHRPTNKPQVSLPQERNPDFV